MFWKKKKLAPNKEKVQNENPEPLTKETAPIELVNNVINDFNSSLIKINELAVSTIENWHHFLIEQDISPVTNKEREQAKSSGLAIPKIAFPSEYRTVIENLKQRYYQQIIKVQEKVKDNFKADDLLDEFVRRKFTSVTEDQLSKYLDRTKPSVSVSDIFANASTSMNKYSVKKEDMGDKSYSIKCNTCGAARLEEDQYEKCFYCGTPLF